MIQHMVWIKFKDAVDDERIAEHMANLAGLADSVPGISALHVGENVTDRANGFTHGLVVTFDSRADLDRYQVHPEHVAVAKPLVGDAQVLAMDIDC